MSNISSNSVFHFTSFENLIGILKNDFCPRYALEKFSEDKDGIPLPMSCFCDIPLSQIKNHLSNYGHYGLGMSKAWAIRNNLNPVLYLPRKSIVIQILFSSFDEILKLEKALKVDQKEPLEILKRNILNFAYRIKPYEGKLYRHGKLAQPERDVRYYDEKEWRYLPDCIEQYETLSEKQYFKANILKAANEKIKSKKITFRTKGY